MRAFAMGIWAVASVTGCQRGTVNSATGNQVDYEARVQQALDDKRSATISLRCEDAGPGQVCGLLVDEVVQGFPDTGQLVDFATASCHEPAGEISDACMAAFTAALIDRMRARYPRAKIERVTSRCVTEKLPCDLKSLASARGVELVFMAAHNDEVKWRCDDTLRQLGAEREQAVEQAEDAARADESRRRVLMAVASGLQGFGHALQASNAAQSTPTTITPSTQAVSACSNDFQCGFGSYCVKAQFAALGTCARVVNSYGTPTFAPPRTESVEPGVTQCTFTVGDCPIGFQCVNNHCSR